MNSNLSNFINNEILTRPNKIAEQLSHDNKKFNHRMDFGYITELLDNFIEKEEINRYLLLPGLRDVGKTTILFQVYEYLHKEKNISSNNILYLSAEMLKNMFNASILDAVVSYLKLYHNTDLLNINEKIFLLIDEAQYDVNWSLTGKILFDSSKKIFMIFTGSSALELEYNADSARRILKMPISPLNYSQHLKLKYDFHTYDVSKSLVELIFDGKMENAIELEEKILKDFSKLENYSLNEWNEYLMHGGFPSSFYQKGSVSLNKLSDIVDRVVNNDIRNISQINGKTQIYAFQLLYLLALQKPGEISQNSIANYLDCPVSSVRKILIVLEKTHLIFHLEPYTSSAKRGNKTFKYYFATPSLKHALCANLGIASHDQQEYEGRLLENLAATIFFNLKNESITMYNTYFDLKNKKKEKNVDFIVQRGFDKPIPIEVGIGRKSNKQIRNAISNYNSEYGIIISDKTQRIEKNDNVISIPARTFSLM